jgi:hypothetical protein
MKNMAFARTKYDKFAIFSVAILCCCAVLPAHARIERPTEPFISYTVKPGDSLQSLSRQLLREPGLWSQLARLNGLSNPNLIRPGLVIDVPQSLLNLAQQPTLATEGRLLSAQGDVLVNGQRVQSGAAVPEGARLQTSPGSSAVVRLSDGSRIQLMPRTIAEITSQRGYQLKDPSSSISTTWFSGAVRLVEGVMDVLADKQAKRLQPLNVITPTSNVGIRGTEFRVAYEDPASRVARTEVLEGKVQVDNNQQGSNAAVGGGFGVAVNPAVREIKVTPLLPALPVNVLPESVQRERAGERRAIWTVGSLSGAAGYRAQLANDAEFNQIVLDAKSGTPALDVAAVPNGVYYARVRGIDPAGIEGFNAVRRITLGDAPLSLIWIREVQLAASVELAAGGSVLSVFNRSVDTPRELTVQLARDAAFTQDVETLRADAEGRVLIASLKAGERRFVRFSGTTPQGQAGTSPTYLLNVPSDWGQTVFTLNQALVPLQ